MAKASSGKLYKPQPTISIAQSKVNEDNLTLYEQLPASARTEAKRLYQETSLPVFDFIAQVLELHDAELL